MGTIQDIERLVIQLMNTRFEFKANGENHVMSARGIGYRFEWDGAKRRFGACHYGHKKITLSKPLCSINLDKIYGKIKDTILHEIAHAFSVEVYGRINGRGHDWRWRGIALAIGCDGKRCYDSSAVEKPKAKYTLSCPNDACDVQGSMHRKPKVNRSCGKCSGGKYNPKYEMILTQNY